MGNENMFSRMWKPPRHSIVSRNVATKHDDSGQVFTEVLCSGGPMIADWVWYVSHIRDMARIPTFSNVIRKAIGKDTRSFSSLLYADFVFPSY